ncbi:MAG: phenylalanine--tRNA ligase subunit alpha [bacterium]|nr:phenylalanine--tRNA ligase subunit alpha [bacterium]
MEHTQTGHMHLISQAIREIADIFAELGFTVADGPEIEDEWHNFDALNIPKDHPARDMQDTFWIKSKERLVLRTHTSPVQVRYMEEKLKKGIKPPYRIIVPGKVFRNEATDATHEAQFYQVDGLYVDKNVSMAQLKGTILLFFRKFFGDDKIDIRFRQSFFPFTEPSVEVDMEWRGKPRREAVGVPTEASEWLEMGGAGLVHPNVFEAVGLSAKKYRGFAFGVGIDRLLMLRHGIPDIRMFYNGDMRVVSQF